MPDGQRVQRSTKETDRKKAQKMADTFEEATRAKQTARAAQRVIADIYQRVTGERLPSSKVQDYFEAWLARKQPETAENTFEFYRGKAAGFLAFLGEKAQGDIARLGAPEVLAFRKAEVERVSVSTVKVRRNERTRVRPLGQIGAMLWFLGSLDSTPFPSVAKLLRGFWRTLPRPATGKAVQP